MYNTIVTAKELKAHKAQDTCEHNFYALMAQQSHEELLTA